MIENIAVLLKIGSFMKLQFDSFTPIKGINRKGFKKYTNAQKLKIWRRK